MSKIVPLFGCAECGCTDIQSTAWVDHNTGKIVPTEPPTDDIWCPQCDKMVTTKICDEEKPHVQTIPQARYKE